MIRAPNSVLTLLARDPTVARAMGTARRRILTTLLLALPIDAFDLVGWYRRALLDGDFSSDPVIVFSLFRALERKGRIDLATSLCGSSLDTRNFAKLVSLVYRHCSPNNREKDRLAETISRHAAVYRNIAVPTFGRLVQQLLDGRRPWERAHGVLSLLSLARIRPGHGMRLTQLVRDPARHVRGNAWAAASTLESRGLLSTSVEELLLSKAQAALKGKDDLVKGNARNYLRAHSQRHGSRAGAPVGDRDLRPRRRRGSEHYGIAIGIV